MQTSRSSRRVFHAGFIGSEVVLLVALVVLAVTVKGHPGPLPGDVGVELWWQHALLPHHRLTTVIEQVSTINWPTPAGAILGAIVLFFLLLRRWLDAIVSLLVSSLADLLSYATDQIVRRPRPNGHGLAILQHITAYFSFPSGHVVHATAFFGFLLFLTWQTRRAPLARWCLRVILLFLIVLMGPSRLLEGEHWPSDVLAGMLVGAFWLILGIHAFRWARLRWPVLLAPDEREALAAETPPDGMPGDVRDVHAS